MSNELEPFAAHQWKISPAPVVFVVLWKNEQTQQIWIQQQYLSLTILQCRNLIQSVVFFISLALFNQTRWFDKDQKNRIRKGSDSIQRMFLSSCKYLFNFFFCKGNYFRSVILKLESFLKRHRTNCLVPRAKTNSADDSALVSALVEVPAHSRRLSERWEGFAQLLSVCRGLRFCWPSGSFWKLFGRSA